MIGIGAALLSAAVWTGSAQVDVMIWEPGGEHPYTTDFQLEYREGERTPIIGLSGVVVGYRVPLVAQRVVISVRHEVRDAQGRSICTGGGDETVRDGPDGVVIVPVSTRELSDVLGSTVPIAGAYQLVLPRAVGAFACGNKKNTRDRWVVLGSGLFHPAGNIETADPTVRPLGPGGSRMEGSYKSTDAPRGDPVRHDYDLKWNLQRHVQQ